MCVWSRRIAKAKTQCGRDLPFGRASLHRLSLKTTSQASLFTVGASLGYAVLVLAVLGGRVDATNLRNVSE